MALKTVYFIRHGQTELNAKGIKQGPDGPLSEKGRQQVVLTAERFIKEGDEDKPQVIISSPYQRTRETADILARELGLEVEYLDLLVERKNPTEIVGHEKNEPVVRSIVDRIDKSFHEDGLKYSDEENFLELRARAKKLLEFIVKRKEKRMIMVTHSIYLKMVMACMLFDDKLTEPEYVKLRYFDTMDNAALTICTCKIHWFKAAEWNLLMWNNELQRQ